MHVLQPAMRQATAASFPQVTTISEPCEAVQGFYASTLYPTWKVPETFGLSRCGLTDRLRRQYPWFAWPYSEDTLHRVLLAGAGSGHQAAQALLTLAQIDIVAFDLSGASLAYGEHQLVRVLPHEVLKSLKLTSVLGDLTHLSAVYGERSDSAASKLFVDRFHYAACIGVLHHVPDPFAALQGLSRALLPGGVLQLATYSSISVQSWRPAARRLLHDLNPDLVDASGELRRRPTERELQCVRRMIFELADEGESDKDNSARPTGDSVETARTICLFEEFYSAGGTLDLLFHPLETAFTLLQLDDMLRRASFQPIGVFFANAASDSVARAAYREHGEGRWASTDPEQADLLNWHALELKQTELFGRMHIVHARRL